MLASVAERCSIGHWAATARKNKSRKHPLVAMAVAPISKQSLNHGNLRDTNITENELLLLSSTFTSLIRVDAIAFHDTISYLETHPFN